MKVKVEIPKGYRALKAGEKCKKGDMIFDPFKSHWVWEVLRPFSGDNGPDYGRVPKGMHHKTIRKIK